MNVNGNRAFKNNVAKVAFVALFKDYSLLTHPHDFHLFQDGFDDKFRNKSEPRDVLKEFDFLKEFLVSVGSDPASHFIDYMGKIYF
jgi:hypothetical protein